MKPKLADLICTPDGTWEICRAYACDKDDSFDEEQKGLRLPLELCPDGHWVLSGLNDHKLRTVFGNPDKPIPQVLFNYIDIELSNLEAEGVFYPEMWPEDANPKRIDYRYWSALNDLKSDIEDFNIALSEDDMDLIERIEQASPLSLAGLLRKAGESDLAFRFLQDCPENILPLAEFPLISIDEEGKDGGINISFLHQIANLGWSDKDELGFGAKTWEVHIRAIGTAEVSVANWMFYARHFRRVELEQHGDLMDEARPLDLLENFTDAVLKLIWKMTYAVRDKLVRQGIEVASSERMSNSLYVCIQKSLEEHVSRTKKLIDERVFPFSGFPHPARYSKYFLGHPDSKIRARRLQLRQAMPFLADCIASGQYPDAAFSVDHGEPLISALAKQLDVPTWVVTCLSKLPDLSALFDSDSYLPNRNSMYLKGKAKTLAAMGSDSPLLKFDPRAPDSALIETAHRVDSILTTGHTNYGRSIFRHPEDDTRLMIHAVGREKHIDGMYYSEDYEASIRDNVVHEMADETAHISLYYCIARNSLRHQLQYDGFQEHELHEDVEAALDVWMRRLNATNLLKNAREVSALMQLYCDDILPDSFRLALAETTESLLVSHVCETTGIEIVPLSSKQALTDEGKAMRHCVGGYWGRAAGHDIELFSLRSQNTGLRATLGVAQDYEGHWRLEEFKHAHNRVVEDKDLLDAAEALCRRLDAITLAPDAQKSSQNAIYTRFDPQLFALQLREPDVRERLLACYPGAGSLQQRMDRALEAVWRRRRRSN